MWNHNRTSIISALTTTVLTFDHNDYYNDNDVVGTGSINLADYPPEPIMWLYNTLDIICDCTNYVLPGNYKFCQWRTWIGIDSDNNIDSWFSEQYKVPSVWSTDIYPNLLSYNEFRLQQQTNKITTNNDDGDNNNIMNIVLSHLYSMYQYAFRTPSTKLGNIVTIPGLIALIIILIILRYVKFRIILPYFTNLGRTIATRTHGIEWIAIPDNIIRINKFGEYCFRLLYHTFISLIAIWCFYEQKFFFDTMYFYIDFPNQEILPGMAWYYLIQSAYNVDALISILEISLTIKFQYPVVSVRKQQKKYGKSYNKTNKLQLPITVRWKDTVRGDFTEMFVHHLITNLLIMFSSFLRTTPVGAVVMFIHDISDVPVDLSKLANFMKWKITTIICFSIMTIVWLYTRLYIFPFHIFNSMCTQSKYFLQRGFSVILYKFYRPIILVLASMLILLHATWFYMMMRMLKALIFKRELHDYSEHKSGEKTTSATTKNFKTE